MPRQFASCPSCGMSVPFAALGFDEDGTRLEDPPRYGTFVKIRSFANRTHLIQWESHPAPREMLFGLLEQLETAVGHVRAQLGITPT
jgi:hypothetical protein